MLDRIGDEVARATSRALDKKPLVRTETFKHNQIDIPS
jgi:hypothetical protein